MGWFANLKIKAKLMLSYFLLCVLLGVIGLMGLNSISTMNDIAVRFDSSFLPGINNIRNVQVQLEQMRYLMAKTLDPDLRPQLTELEKEIGVVGKTVDSSLTGYEAAVISEANRVMLEDFRKVLAPERQTRAKVAELTRNGDYAAANELYDSVLAGQLEDCVTQIEKMVAWNEASSKTFAGDAANTYDAAVMTMTSLIVAGIIIALLLGFFIARSIEQPIKKLVEISNEIAAGNLRHKIVAKTKDEIGILEMAVSKMIENLRDVITNVQKNSELVAASSEELTASADQSAQASNSVATSVMNVSQGAEKTLGVIVDVVNSITTMSSESEEATANATTVAASSDKTAAAAAEGGKAVDTAIRQMVSIQNTVETLAKEITGLGVRSNEIGQIVETISGIAGQTNLLALNAAIEAARAGEQGRGFAVVAEEVRKLAEQSQDAAKQISELISAIQQDTSNAVQAMEAGTKEVKTGAELVDNAGVAFREIAGLIEQSSSEVRAISGAINQIATKNEDVLEGAQNVQNFGQDISGQMQSISAATEQQLASMQEIASSSQTLSKRAEELQKIVQKFTI